MPKFIIVHKNYKDEEIILNADHVAHAHTVTTQNGTYTSVKMVNGDSFSLTENLYDLIGLAQ